MKLSINFLRDYVDVPVDMVTLGEDMTNVGNEYDSASKITYEKHMEDLKNGEHKKTQ